jgi:hypothetical protein
LWASRSSFIDFVSFSWFLTFVKIWSLFSSSVYEPEFTSKPPTTNSTDITKPMDQLVPPTLSLPLNFSLIRLPQKVPILAVYSSVSTPIATPPQKISSTHYRCYNSTHLMLCTTDKFSKNKINVVK